MTAALHAIDSRYSLFPRLKVGPGRTAGYRLTTADHLSSLRARGELIWENARYGAMYAIDRAGLIDHLARHIGIVHLGQAEAVDTLRTATPDVHWLVVELRCARDEVVARLRSRDSASLDARLRAFDETQPLTNANLNIDTTNIKPSTAARSIDQAVTSGIRD